MSQALRSSVTVELPDYQYDVAIAAGGLQYLGQLIRERATFSSRIGTRMLLVSNPTVFEHYGTTAIAALEAANYDVQVCLLPDGEQFKTLESIQQVYDAALGHRLERSSTLVALGGGVIGDMTGFAAATWLRGIHFVQVPTTLLSMVDASVGGKTGVNHPKGKNLIGAFYQPRLVLIDPQVLSTLPAREFRAGMAEVIKYGVIWDPELFHDLEVANSLAPESIAESLLQEILSRSCQAKAQVVSQDEKEAGLRAILNYGHTIGHAVESLTNYQTVVHGEAVAIGMVAAGRIAMALKLWDAESCDRQQALLEKAGLPTQLPAGLDLDAVLTSLQSDKKVKAGRVRFILPTQIGQATITDQVPDRMIYQVLESMAA